MAKCFLCFCPSILITTVHFLSLTTEWKIALNRKDTIFDRSSNSCPYKRLPWSTVACTRADCPTNRQNLLASDIIPLQNASLSWNLSKFISFRVVLCGFSLGKTQRNVVMSTITGALGCEQNCRYLNLNLNYKLDQITHIVFQQT